LFFFSFIVCSRASKLKKSISLETVNQHQNRQQAASSADKQNVVRTVTQSVSVSGAPTTFVHSIGEALAMSSGPKKPTPTLIATAASDKILPPAPSSSAMKRNVANDDKVL
jgi:hypothetical protein